MSNLRKAFAHGKAFVAFITCGDPDLETTAKAVRAMAEGGADLIELGIPFSDPTAEGPVIQSANVRALSAGTTTDKIFEMVKKLRNDVKIPMVFMTYANVVFSYGTERFAEMCAQVGMDGVILPDVPYEEKEEFAPIFEAHGLELVSLIAPTSADRIAMIAKEAKGFIYVVSSLGDGGMPKLNLKNPEVEKFITDVACYWIKECNIDGWRMDVGDEISHYFWKNFRRAVKAVKKDMLIIGEIWHYAGDFLEGDEWDTVMNYPFYLNLIDLLADEKIQVSQFIQNLGYLKGRLNKKCYPLMWNLIDSHDTARFLHLCNGNKKKQHLAAAFQLLLPGMPMIYYGDEFAMPGANDPDCRRGMYWDEEYQDKEMYEWYKQLLWIRKKHACISEGELIGAITKDEEETIVLIRKNVEETIALIFNCSSNAKNFSEYEGKYNLLRDEPFNGKVEGLDAAVIVL